MQDKAPNKLIDLIEVETPRCSSQSPIEPLRKWEEEIVNGDVLFLAFCDAVSNCNARSENGVDINEYWDKVGRAVTLWNKRVDEQRKHLEIQEKAIDRIAEIETGRTKQRDIEGRKEQIDLFARGVGILTLMSQCARFAAEKLDSILQIKDQDLAPAIIARAIEETLPPAIEPGNRPWAAGFILLLRLFLERGHHDASPMIRVPFASYNEETGEDEPGEILTLEMTIVENDSGAILQHPSDLLAGRWSIDDTFMKAVNDAFELAYRDALAADLSEQERHTAGRRGIIWRVLEYRPGSAVTEIVGEGQTASRTAGRGRRTLKGNSVGGAAARGLFCALLRKMPDPEVIVFAAVRARHLINVGGVKAKTKAVALAGGIDTIVVASTENRKDAEEALVEGGAVRVAQVEPTENGPGWKFYIELKDGRVLKVVNLDETDKGD
jgi:hypothetical protein